MTAFAFLLPDLIDKPLWILGVISDGRYIGHTLLVAFLVALVFSLKKRVYGLFAICGWISHLLLDIRGFVPWFYPFKSYDFPSVDLPWDHHLVRRSLHAARAGLLCSIVVSAVVSLILSFASWVRGRRHPEARDVSQSANSMHSDQ